MPLESDVSALLDTMNAAGGKPPEESTVAEVRAGAWDWLGLVGEPEPVARVEHRFIPGPTADLPIRIYTPEGEGPFPGLVFFHGSGWTISNIELTDTPHRALANRTGCVLVAVNYQKAPEHKFPVPFDDAYGATCWVAEHAAEFDIDPEGIGVGGDSAGGNLAAAVCLKARDQGGPSLSFQLLAYPAIDYRFDFASSVENAQGYMLTTTTTKWFWDQYLTDPSDADNPFACPVRADNHAGLPPAIVVTAEYDPIRDDGETYAQCLADAGVPVIRRRYDGMVHGFLWMSGVVEGSRRLIDDLGDDVRTILSRARQR
jgi:acetyl esterase